jgi:hypothetical protein
MLRHVPSWPKIIAMFVAGLGVAGVLGAQSVNYAGSSYPLRNWIAFDWRIVAISILLLLVSYPLARGRDWARRVTRAAVAVVGLSLVIYYLARLVSPVSFSDLTPEQIKVVRLSMRLEDASTLFVVLISLVFGVSFLSHPDVVASFQSSRNAPEEA